MRPDLGDFLRSRRDRLRPEDFGLPAGNRRRVKGLRREELAQLAGISADYYIRIEQGRVQQPSDSVLDALSTTLRLDADERAHLRNLLGTKPSKPQPGGLRDSLAQTVSAIEGGPAYLLDRTTNVLAWNRLAGILFEPALTKPNPNIARFVFLDKASHEVFADRPNITRSTAAFLRLTAGKHPDDPALQAIVAELTNGSEEFRHLWSEQLVADRTHGRKHFTHPSTGPLTLDYEALRDSTDHVLMVFTASPGSPADRALRSWYSQPQENHDLVTAPAPSYGSADTPATERDRDVPQHREPPTRTTEHR